MKLKEEMRWHLFSVAEPLFMEIWMLNVSVKRAKMRAVTTDILFDVDCEPLWVPLCSFQNFAACFATLSERCSVHVEEQPHPSQNPRRSVVYELAFWAQVTWKVHLAKETSTVGKRLLKASHLYFFNKMGAFSPSFQSRALKVTVTIPRWDLLLTSSTYWLLICCLCLLLACEFHLQHLAQSPTLTILCAPLSKWA